MASRPIGLKLQERIRSSRKLPPPSWATRSSSLRRWKTLNTSVFAAKALDVGLSTGEISLDKLHLLLGCSRGQAIGAVFDLQEQGLAEDIETTKSRSGEYFLVPIDTRCEAARLYRAKLEQLSRDMGLYEVIEKTLPALQAIFIDALSAMEAKQIKR